MLNQNPDPDRDSNEILTELYGELRQLATSMLAHERGTHINGHGTGARSLSQLLGPQATGKSQIAELYADPRRFFGAAAEAMRRILIDCFGTNFVIGSNIGKGQRQCSMTFASEESVAGKVINTRLS